MDEPTTITPDEAEKRFGTLPTGAAKVHQEFKTEEGLWRPEFGPRLRLTGYKLHRRTKRLPKLPTRPKRR